MNENLDLTKILDGCPVGTEFYHAGYGRVWLAKIYSDAETNAYPIALSLNENNPLCHNLYVTANGTISYGFDGECLLLPSKDQRDWSKFERFWDKPKVERFDINTLKPFDKVLVRLSENRIWFPDFFGYKDNIGPICAINNCIKRQCIPYNEETKHLIGTTDDCPEYYKWWEE